MSEPFETVPLGVFHAMVVPSGTKVTDDRTGDSCIVDDENCAVKGKVIWCTQAVYDELKGIINGAEQARKWDGILV